MDWTPEACQRLRTMWVGDGMLSSEIAKTFGISRSAVMGKVNRLGLCGTRRGSGLNRQKLSDLATATRFAAKVKAKARMAAPPKIIQPPVAKVAKVTTPSRTKHEPQLKRWAREEGGGRPWTERKWNQCCYPTQGRGADMFYCCEPAIDRRYCARHADLCYEAVRGFRNRFDRGSGGPAKSAGSPA